MILMPWTKRRLVREALAAGHAAQQDNESIYTDSEKETL